MKYIKFLVLAALVCFFYSKGTSQTAVGRHGKLHVAAGKILDQRNKVVQLRGISLSWSVWGGKKYYNPAVVDALVDDFNINILRVSMAVEPEGGYLESPLRQFLLISKVIDRAIERGIYVLIDWHDHHADRHVEQAKVFFKQIAQRYAGHPQLIYEIWNEPERISWQEVKNYAIELITTIRNQGQDNIIVVGSPHWDQDVDIVAEDLILGFHNIAYSFHFYASDPNHQVVLRKRADRAIALKLPLMVTEWGVGESDGDGVFDLEKTRAWLEWMEKNQLSWINWNLTDKAETTALLMPGASVHGRWKEQELTVAGQYIKTQLTTLNATVQQSQLIDKQATKHTQALYRNLKIWSADYVLFGQQDATAYGHGWSGDRDRSDVKSVSGSHPSIIGFDFMGLSGLSPTATAENQALLLQQVTDTYNRGGIVTICWHFNNPVSNDGFYWNDSTAVAAMGAIKPGGSHHDQYKELLKNIARFALQAKGKDGALIPIIFRPYHEFDGDWFWWGKRHTPREDFIAVWQFTVAYLRDELNVHNFIYAFSPDCNLRSEDAYLERYPGDEWVDIIGMDNYADFGRDGHYNMDEAVHKLRIITAYAERKNKVAALTETGLESIPNAYWWTSVLLKTLKASGVRLAYAMVWRNDEHSPLHYYAPFPGQLSEPDFLNFYQDPFTWFEKDLQHPYE